MDDRLPVVLKPARWRQVLDTVASVAIILAAAAILWRFALARPPKNDTPPPDGPLPTAPVSLDPS